MTAIIALDLSKRSTGFAAWQDGWDEPRYGIWELGTVFTSEGRTFVKLHTRLDEVRKVVCRFDHLFYEEAINPASLSGHTNIETLRVLSGLCAHAESYGYARKVRTHRINISTWRKDFIGSMEITDARRRAKARGESATGELKSLTMERCRQYGWSPRKNDEADALGVLDYGCTQLGIVPPWRVNETLRPMLTGARI